MKKQAIMKKQAALRMFVLIVSLNLRSFRKFLQVFEVLGVAGTCLDLFGCVRMGLDASGCVRKHSDTFGKFRKKSVNKSVFRTFGEIFEELRKNGRHHQILREKLPYIHLFPALWDRKSSKIRSRRSVHVWEGWRVQKPMGLQEGGGYKNPWVHKLQTPLG